MRKILIGVGLLAVISAQSCDVQQPPQTTTALQGRGSQFTLLHEERWGSWQLYILQHRSGHCFIVADPPGEGGGAITQADTEVCVPKPTPVEQK